MVVPEEKREQGGQGDEDGAADADLAEEVAVVEGLRVRRRPAEAQEVVAQQAQADEADYLES